MLKLLHEFNPNASIIKGSHTSYFTITIQPTNVAFSDEIPKQFTNSGIEDFVYYVKSCPLRYVLCDFPNPFYPKQVCEFYYSCFVDNDARTITGTIRDGQYTVTSDVESF
ncbi:unnamed protein product [Lactuca saligna]|uniref:Uncharacterized protein n=1 Tax=Lactuca saligna TaxID=75948 RepID=A0AA36EKL3_LACSI|nr:unnamed protein product [Lactuca saligna]